MKDIETRQQAKDTQYRKSIPPFIMQVMVDVVKEQRKIVEGTYEDQVEDMAKQKEDEKQYKVCVQCTFGEVLRRSRTCPKCKQNCSLTAVKSLGITPEKHGDYHETKTKERDPKETGAHISKTRSTKLHMKHFVESAPMSMRTLVKGTPQPHQD